MPPARRGNDQPLMVRDRLIEFPERVTRMAPISSRRLPSGKLPEEVCGIAFLRSGGDRGPYRPNRAVSRQSTTLQPSLPTDDVIGSSGPLSSGQ